MPEITIEFDPAPATLVDPQQVAEEAHKIFRGATEQAVVRLHEKVVGYTPMAFGYLRKSIMPQVLVSHNEIMGTVSTSRDYALAVELGSRPHWPPLAPLILWVKRKLGGRGSNIAFEAKLTGKSLRKQGFRGVKTSEIKGGIEEGIARRIQFKIAHKGTKYHLMFQKGFNESRGTVERYFDDATDRFIQAVSKM